MGKVRIPGRHVTTNGSENSANHVAPQVKIEIATAVIDLHLRRGMVSAILTPVRGDVSSWDPDFAHRKMARLLQVMLRQSAVLAISLLAFVYTFKIDDIPEEFRELMPPEVKDFVAGLSDADKAILKEVVKSKTDFQSEDEIAAAIKEKSSDLGARVAKIHDVWKKKVAALGPEAQAFAKESMKNGLKIRAKYFADSNPNKAVLKEGALAVIQKFQKLSDDAKADFKKQFPEIGEIISNDLIIKRLEALN